MFLFQLFQKTAFIINSRKKHIKECQKKSKIGKKKLKLNSDNLRDHWWCSDSEIWVGHLLGMKTQSMMSFTCQGKLGTR